MGETINGYRLTTGFSNSNAGMCQWAFARKGGHDYFLKQLLSPKYPLEAAQKSLSPEIVRRMRQEADAFFAQRSFFFDRLRECRTGNIIVVLEFFREKEFFYLITDRLFGPFLRLEQVAALDEEKKRTLYKAII